MNIGKVMEKDFGVTASRGFLPKEDPQMWLPVSLMQYDEFGRQLPDFLGAGIVRRRVAELEMPPYPLDRLSVRQQILLKIRLDFIISAFRYEKAHLSFSPRKYKEAEMHTVVIPQNISVPLFEVSKQLGVLPVLSYSFYALHNWARLNRDNSNITVDNLRLLQHFTGGLDERHFILVHTEIEKHLAPAVSCAPFVQQEILQGNIEKIIEYLEITLEAQKKAVATMKTMTDSCHPDVYYLRVRPYIFGHNTEGAHGTVIFEGVDNQTPALRGETGAQTPSWPLLWAFFGIEFPNDRLKQHVVEMRNYWMREHRKYIEWIERGPSLRGAVIAHIENNKPKANDLREAYNANLDALHSFFELHLKYADEYIHQKAQKYIHPKQGTHGTGSTPFIEYLKHHCDVIKAHKI